MATTIGTIMVGGVWAFFGVGGAIYFGIEGYNMAQQWQLSGKTVIEKVINGTVVFVCVTTCSFMGFVVGSLLFWAWIEGMIERYPSMKGW